MDRDWVAWHQAYDRPGSDLSRRLEVVRAQLAAALDRCPPGPIRLLSLCAGDGRDVLPVLASHPRAADVSAVLVETDEVLAGRARAAVASLPDGAGTVDMRTADAGAVDVWADGVPAQVVLACGVFGNLAPDQVRQCVSTLPVACAPEGVLMWTRGRGAEDPGPDLDRWLCTAGFEPVARVAPERARYRVGVDTYVGPRRQPVPGERLFTGFR
ncbi:MAG TPA: SAM-dependent methyltransferase [Candidatus Limnocylindria bacterium]|nr:SAM-dependent methyltransferase [Candidatus Limnocylindria bacterium]